MSNPTAFSFSEINPPKTGVLIVLAEEGGQLSPAAAALDKQSKGTLSRAVEAARFKGKKKSAIDLLVPGGLDLTRLIIAGAGKLKDYTEDDWRSLGGILRAKLSGRDSDQATIIVEGADGTEISGAQVAELALGALLRSYKFDRYKTDLRKSGDEDDDEEKKAKKKDVAKITIQCRDVDGAKKAFTSRKALGEGVVFARDLTNEPANVLGPTEFSERLQNLTELGVEVEVLHEKALNDLGMRALLAVGQGSARPSYVVVLQWKGGGKQGGKPIAIVGKGVCFDTGGLSMKPPQGMEEMKGDMAGAACVAGLMHALAARKAKVNAVGIVALVENMPSGTAQRPGDVVTAMSGQTIEVLNTDAEGRLILADALWYTQDRFKPVAIVNLATLTGAIMVALGKEHAGLFSNDDELSARLTAAGQSTGEKVWRLPLDSKYDKLIDSEVADMKNIGGRWGGSITAAQFLQRFIKDGMPWAHLDIAGTGMSAPKTDINQSWGSGYGVRLLDRLIADHYER